MTKINSDLFSRIKNKFLEDNNAYIKSKLEISKWFFSFIVLVYFFLYLSTIAGFLLDITPKLLAWIYPVFLFSIFALLYDLIIYALYRNSEKVNIYKIPIIAIFVILFIIMVAISFGLKLN